jgi:hypothetical protein
MRLVMAALCLSAFSAPRAARAHTTGISQADFVVEPDGRVAATLVFAANELTIPAADHARFVTEGVGVSADGSPCAASFVGSHAVEMDGVELDATFACAKGAREVEVVVYLFNDLAQGHRMAASMTSGALSSYRLLSGDHRLIALTLGERKPVLSEAKSVALVVVSSVFLAVLLGACVWRFRRKKPRIPS